jgi:hypothetical protein
MIGVASMYVYQLIFLVSVGFFEERAIVLGKLGLHEEALAIYIHILHENRMAEEYVFLSRYHTTDVGEII